LTPLTPGHRHRPAAPPLPHVVEQGRAGRPVAVEGDEDLSLGNPVRERLPPLVTFRRADRPEGPFGQVELCVQVVVGTDGADQDGCRIRSIGHEHPP
jgi:hypothetical protein